MSRTAVLAFLALLPLSACDLLGCHEIPFTNQPGEEVRLKEGTWSFDIDTVESSGGCDLEALEADELRLHGSIFYARDQQLEIEIEGLLLTGEQNGHSVFADGSEWSDVPYAGGADPEEGEDSPAPSSDDEPDVEKCEKDDYGCAEYPEEPGLYVSIDGTIEGRADLIGTLIIEQNIPGEHCVIQAQYTGRYRGMGGQGEPSAPSVAGTSSSSAGSAPEAD
ncbi:MAG: hypothetical protein P8R54_10895 [Myxococcota bacterium]|nr:hypothetical protein [Myxococcota bacterium]